MDQHVPAHPSGRPQRQHRQAEKWRAQGFATEVEMLDWLENQPSARPPPHRRGQALGAALGCGMVAAGLLTLSRLLSPRRWTR